MSMRGSRKDIGSVIICDDVRQEYNGKEILIGVYSGHIIVPSTPFSIKLSIWFEYMAPRKEGNTVYMKISYNEQKRVEFKGTVEVLTECSMGITFPPFTLNSDSVGELMIQYSRNGVEWTDVKRKKIMVGLVELHGKLQL
jgi:hypothetical protein